MAAKYDIALDAGSDFTLHLSFKSKTGQTLNLSGASARMQIKCKHSEEACFDELSTSNGRIVIEDDRISLKFPHNVTENYEKNAGVYDIKLTQADGTVLRVLEGRVTATPGVTR